MDKSIMDLTSRTGVAEPTTILGMDGSSVLIAGAIFLSAIMGAGIALFTIGHQRMISRKKTAYNLAYTLRRPTLQKSERVFLDRCVKGRWRRIVKPKTSDDRRQKQEIANYLNHFEWACVAMRQNIVDEGVLKAVIGDTLVKRYSAARPLIHLIRTETGDDEIFEHFEHVARKWKDYPKIPSRNVLRTAWHQVTNT